MDIDRPFIKQVINGFDTMEHMSTVGLDAAITTAAELCMPSGAICEELVWRYGDCEQDTLVLFEAVKGGYKVRKGIGFPLYSEMLIQYPGVYTKEQICARWDVLDYTDIARTGNLHMLKFAHESGRLGDDSTCTAAAEKGYLEVLKYLHESECPWNAAASQAAAKNGHLEVLKYLHENGCPWDAKACEAAARNGHLEVVKYLHENGCPYPTGIYIHATRHLQVLKYLHENGVPWDAERVMDNAVKMGYLDVVKYLRAAGIESPFNNRKLLEDLTAKASLNGHLEMVKYLHENGGSVTNHVLYAVALHGHLKVLQYLHETGHPWRIDIFIEAAAGGHFSMMKHLLVEGCPWDEDVTSAALQIDIHRGDASAFSNKVRIIRWLARHGCPFNEDHEMEELPADIVSDSDSDLESEFN